MPIPPPPSDLLHGAALFLDFDGTLVELAETPDAIRVGHQLGDMLAELAARIGGRLAIVSGRSLADLRRHLPSSRITLSGSHGFEIAFSGEADVAAPVPLGVKEAKAQVRAFVADRPDLLVEEKPAGVALHFRQAPAQAASVSAFMTSLAAATGLALQHGKMVAELRAHGIDKGDAVRTLMATPAFAGGRPVFVGDDLTDEHAFAAAVALGGSGVLVGAERETAAAYRLNSVSAVAAWLRGKRCET